MNVKERIEPSPGDRVLWIRFVAFGDVLQSVADAYNFKKRFPEVHLTFLTYPEYAELIRDQPYIDDVFSGRKKPITKWWQTARNIRAGHYKWLVNDHLGGKSTLLTFFSRAKHRIGSCNLPFLKHVYHISLDLWSKHCGINMKKRSCPLIFASGEDMKDALALLSHLPERRLFVVIGGAIVEKMWPTERWIEFLHLIAEKGWGVVLSGYGQIEEAIGQQIEDALSSENVLNLIGKLNFGKVAAVVRRCTITVGHDTGPLHLSALSGVPTLGLFNYPASGSAKDLLGISWFRELRAGDYVNEKINPIKNLPAEPVIKAFDAFAEEFLPRAFEWRNG